jgi:glycosyltransferase involved in cell wall biosynthesis
MTRITIVVPCFNEALRLPARRLLDFAASQPRVTLLLVNDGSTDDTAGVLDRLAQRRPARISVLNLARNSGKAEAVRQGLLAAAASGDDYLGYWDADLATPLDDVLRFADVLDRRLDVQLVAGVRLPLLGRRVERRPLRRLLGRLFASAAGAVLGQPVCDTQCGAKLLRWGPAMDQIIREPFLSRWIFDVELMARLQATCGELERSVYELPVETWRDVGGSKVRPRDFLRAARELAQIGWRYRMLRSWQPEESLIEISPPRTIATNAGGGRRRAA